jgi:hypothetical protein
MDVKKYKYQLKTSLATYVKSEYESKHIVLNTIYTEISTPFKHDVVNYITGSSTAFQTRYNIYKSDNRYISYVVVQFSAIKMLFPFITI